MTENERKAIVSIFSNLNGIKNHASLLSEEIKKEFLTEEIQEALMRTEAAAIKYIKKDFSIEGRLVCVLAGGSKFEAKKSFYALQIAKLSNPIDIEVLHVSKEMAQKAAQYLFDCVRVSGCIWPVLETKEHAQYERIEINKIELVEASA